MVIPVAGVFQHLFNLFTVFGVVCHDFLVAILTQALEAKFQRCAARLHELSDAHELQRVEKEARLVAAGSH